MNIRLLSFALICFATTQAQIIESPYINTVLKHVNVHNKRTLVIFDIDNTIMEPTGHVGGDNWFLASWNKEMASGLSPIDALNKVLPVYYKLQNKITVKPVESCVVPLIKRLKKCRLPVIALTARSIPIIDITVKLLTSINIEFPATSLGATTFIEDNKPDKPIFYYHGIVFCAQEDKGACLEAFLKRAVCMPKKIVYVDDHREYLESVEKVAQKHNIKFIGIRYSHLDEKTKQYRL